jgi:hypothetical protein
MDLDGVSIDSMVLVPAQMPGKPPTLHFAGHHVREILSFRDTTTRQLMKARIRATIAVAWMIAAASPRAENCDESTNFPTA